MNPALDAARDAWSLALAFNPLVAALASAVFAALLSKARSPWTRAFSWLGLLAVWAMAEGVALLVFGERATAVSGTAAQIAYVVGAAGGFLIGYALPTWTGAFVGRNVTFGTGWLSAAFVALGASAAVSAIVGRFA